jgi:endo-1,4-beta-D-glucanase Y
MVDIIDRPDGKQTLFSRDIYYKNGTVVHGEGEVDRATNQGPRWTVTESTVTKSTGIVNPLLAPNKAVADKALKENYAKWKDNFLRDGGDGSLRVARPDNNEDTVSEGQAYGMLLAAINGDKDTFDKLWLYAQRRLNGNGLMAWHINQKGDTLDKNAATDADQDMAFALIIADQKWGGPNSSYRKDAKALINNIMKHEVEAGTNVLKPGDTWGGSICTNPSYFAPAYYKVFQAYTGDPRWGKVADKAYEIINKAANPKTGLVPDWCTADGKPVTEVKDKPFSYGYDAMRTPWRIGLDAAWNNDPRAIAFLTKINDFFKSQGVANIKDKYNLDGTDPGHTYHNVAGVSMAATAAVVDSDSGYRESLWNNVATTMPREHNNYYNESMRALSLLFIGNHMTKPTI